MTPSASEAEGRDDMTASAFAAESGVDTSAYAEGGYGVTTPELVPESLPSVGGPELVAEPAHTLEAEPAPSLEELFAEPFGGGPYSSRSHRRAKPGPPTPRRPREGGYGATASAYAAETAKAATAGPRRTRPKEAAA